MDLDGAVAVVTGGAGGIGRAMAGRFHAGGARVAVVDLHATATAATAEALDGSLAIGADVTDEAALRVAVEQAETQLGPIDVFCSNAGVAAGRGLGSDEDWARSWALHGMAHVYAARAVLPGMAARGRGDFVVTASAAGLLMMMQSAPYTVTKHASVAIAEWLAVEWGGSGVALHCLAPQGVRTAMIEADPQGAAEVAASGRILEPSEVADAVVAAIESGEFLVTPHPEVRDYERAKVADRTTWLARMQRLKARI